MAGSDRKGTVLILTLWALTVLTIFTVSIGARIGQKMMAISHLGKREQLHFNALAGVQKAIAVIYFSKKNERVPFMTPADRTFLFDNPAAFESVAFGQGSYTVSTFNFLQDAYLPERKFGVSDEESKLNINKAALRELTILFRLILGLTPEEASQLAVSVVDWREFGQGEAVGFYSDDYYANLEYPYQPKNEPFETLDELRLVKGMTPGRYERLVDFVTIYGNGQVNINTASRQVLMALGLHHSTVDKIFALRRGADGKAFTNDDQFITAFIDSTHFEYYQQKWGFSKNEIDLLSRLFDQNKICLNSTAYRIKSIAKLSYSRQANMITCVFSAGMREILYWREQYFIQDQDDI